MLSIILRAAIVLFRVLLACELISSIEKPVISTSVCRALQKTSRLIYFFSAFSKNSRRPSIVVGISFAVSFDTMFFIVRIVWRFFAKIHPLFPKVPTFAHKSTKRHEKARKGSHFPTIFRRFHIKYCNTICYAVLRKNSAG